MNSKAGLQSEALPANDRHTMRGTTFVSYPISAGKAVHTPVLSPSSLGKILLVGVFHPGVETMNLLTPNEPLLANARGSNAAL